MREGVKPYGLMSPPGGVGFGGFGPSSPGSVSFGGFFVSGSFGNLQCHCAKVWLFNRKFPVRVSSNKTHPCHTWVITFTQLPLQGTSSLSGAGGLMVAAAI